MGSNDGRELKINLNSSEFFVPQTTTSDYLLAEASAATGGDLALKLSKLNYFLHALEDESRKIDAFKRELPFSMQIITHVIEKVKDEVVELKKKEKEAEMEEFLRPLKRISDEGEGAQWSNEEKKKWMNSATLWNNPVECDGHRKSVLEEDGDTEFRPAEFKNEGGAFQPYKRKTATEVEEEPEKAVDLAISIPLGRGRGRNVSSQSKKHRRSWSPELHQRFVDALDKLGGAQAATPKQIIEIMRVDGLTNDEVKSHLQKYRLHVRRLPPSSDQKAAKMAAMSDSPKGPLHLSSSSARENSMTLTNIQEGEEDEEEISESSWKRHL